MSKQTTAIIFSVLLLSTLAHVPLENYQRNHQVAHQKNNHGAHSKNHHPAHRYLQHNFRDNSHDHCEVVCTSSNNTNELYVIINTTNHIIAVLNTTAHVAIAFDIQTHLIALFNGTSGAAIIIDVERNTLIYIKGGVTHDTWYQEYFAGYINSLTSLKVVWELGLKVGRSVRLDSVDEVILEAIAGVLKNLSPDYSLQLSVSVAGSLKLLLEIDRRVTTIFGGYLKGFLSIVESATILIHGDFLWFIAVLDGLGALFAEIRGGISLLIEKGVKLDLKIILAARTGVQVFIYIVRVLIKYVNVSIVLEGVLSSGEKLLELLVKLGGDVSRGVTGVFKIVLAVLGLIDGSVTVELVIDTLIEFSISGSGGASLKQELAAAIESLLKLGDQIKASGFEVCLSFLKKLRDNQLTINGVNISAIIAVLVQVGTISALVLIVRVLILLEKIVKIQVVIPLLLLALIVRLTTVAGLRVVETVVGIQFNVTVEDSGKVNVLSVILKGVSVSVLHKILKGDFSGIPVIVKIYGAFEVAIKIASGGSLQISEIIQSSYAAETLKRIVALLVAAVRGNIDPGLVTQIVSNTTERYSYNYTYTEIGIIGNSSVNGTDHDPHSTESSHHGDDGDHDHDHGEDHDHGHGEDHDHGHGHGEDEDENRHHHHKERNHGHLGHARNHLAHQGKLHHQHTEEKHHLHGKDRVHEKEHKA